MTKQGNKINPNFSEELVGIIIESYLTFISFPFMNFCIEPLSRKDEAKYGADARLIDRRASKIIPFYMQFKRPVGYLSKSTSKIIKDRKFLSLNNDPHALFFELRKKAKNATEYQHNVLFNLNNKHPAAYVCPLFLKRKKYRNILYRFAVKNWWKCSRQIISKKQQDIFIQKTGIKKLIKSIHGVPQIPGHIAFIPHAKVTKHQHKYSFSVNGNDLCFHSPKRIEANLFSFPEFIEHVANVSNEKIITHDNANEKLNELIRNVEPDFQLPERGKIYPEKPFDRWLEWGEYLRKNYNIHQYMMVIRKNE